MEIWQVAAARSGLGGSRSRKPRLLVRETFQKSSRFVWRISVFGDKRKPTFGTNSKDPLEFTNGVVRRR